MDSKPFLQKTPAVVIGALISCALWGAAFPAIKTGYELFEIDSADTGSQMIFAGLRFVLAGVIAWIIGSCSAKRVLLPKKSSWWMVLVLGLLQTAGQYVFFYIGLAHTSGVNASIVGALNVFAALLIAVFIFRQEKLNWRKAAGCFIGFVGVLVIELSGGAAAGKFSFFGEGFIFVSAVLGAFASVLIKGFSKKEHPVTLNSYQFVTGGLVLMLSGFVFRKNGRVFEHSFSIASFKALAAEGQLWNCILVIALLACISGIAYSVWYILLKYNSVSRVTVFGFMTPVFGVLLSMAFLHEGGQHPVWAVLLALVLVSAGTLMVQAGRMSADN